MALKINIEQLCKYTIIRLTLEVPRLDYLHETSRCMADEGGPEARMIEQSDLKFQGSSNCAGLRSHDFGYVELDAPNKILSSASRSRKVKMVVCGPGLIIY